MASGDAMSGATSCAMASNAMHSTTVASPHLERHEIYLAASLGIKFLLIINWDNLDVNDDKYMDLMVQLHRDAWYGTCYVIRDTC